LSSLVSDSEPGSAGLLPVSSYCDQKTDNPCGDPTGVVIVSTERSVSAIIGSFDLGAVVIDEDEMVIAGHCQLYNAVAIPDLQAVVSGISGELIVTDVDVDVVDMGDLTLNNVSSHLCLCVVAEDDSDTAGDGRDDE